MSARLIDGKRHAEVIRSEIKTQVHDLHSKTGHVPGLAVILVGERKDSQTYVRMKQRAASEVGIKSFLTTFPTTVSQERLLEEVHAMNSNPEIHGILIQLPLPAHINEEEVLGSVDLRKDVDGFHPINIGRIAMKGRKPLAEPCTPKGCIELLDREGITIDGKNVVVVGRSNIVGLPVSLMLLHRNATVTICHSRTQDLPSKVHSADILIAAVGKAEMIKGSWIKPGAIVIDVGVNPVDDASTKQGYRLVGDVEFASAKDIAGAITPVPGGVGPMTIAMLLQNTLTAANREYLPQQHDHELH